MRDDQCHSGRHPQRDHHLPGRRGRPGLDDDPPLTVNQAASTTALTITPSTASCGQSVTLCAQVTTTPPGTCAPTGTVTFTIAGGPTLTGTLNASGQACVTTSAIPVGTHAVTATYGGSTGVAARPAPGPSRSTRASPPRP
ncbi:Ig-like domain-containing protein [Streptomyces indonesiensis]